MIKLIKLAKYPNHINEYLTHWTGGGGKIDEVAFDILRKIVKTKELKFKINPISYPNNQMKIEVPNNQMKIEVPMICFTDTPIKQSLEHCLKFNYFGISFNKKELIEYGANPVLYIVKNRIYHQEFIEHLRFDKNKDQNLINFFGSILQPYNSKNIEEQNSAEFYEREWRITRILPFSAQKLAIDCQGSFDENKFKGRIRKNQIGKNLNDVEFYLQYNSAIIENIIVPKQYLSMGQDLIKNEGLKCDLFVIN